MGEKAWEKRSLLEVMAHHLSTVQKLGKGVDGERWVKIEFSTIERTIQMMFTLSCLRTVPPTPYSLLTRVGRRRVSMASGGCELLCLCSGKLVGKGHDSLSCLARFHVS